jgi:hypothetical protein
VYTVGAAAVLDAASSFAGGTAYGAHCSRLLEHTHTQPSPSAGSQ